MPLAKETVSPEDVKKFGQLMGNLKRDNGLVLQTLKQSASEANDLAKTFQDLQSNVNKVKVNEDSDYNNLDDVNAVLDGIKEKDDHEKKIQKLWDLYQDTADKIDKSNDLLSKLMK